MKKVLTGFIVLAVLATFMTCQKNVCLTIAEVAPVIPTADTLSSHHVDRNDIPPPPDEQWWTLDTDNLDNCQRRLWGYLKRMYPNKEEDYWNYEIYSIMDEPAEVFENRAFTLQFLKFFNDTMLFQYLGDTTLPCANVDTTFFLEALGQPTCKGDGFYSGETNYLYYFKVRYREGPCPNIFNEGSDSESKCQFGHLRYCPFLMKMNFDPTTGMLRYIDFLPQ